MAITTKVIFQLAVNPIISPTRRVKHACSWFESVSPAMQEYVRGNGEQREMEARVIIESEILMVGNELDKDRIMTATYSPSVDWYTDRQTDNGCSQWNN